MIPEDRQCSRHSTASKQYFARDAHLPVGEKPALGSHLVIARTLYSHHGIYVGNDHVIHYAGAGHGLRRGSVEEVSLEHFAHGRGIRVRHDRPRFDRREVLARARSRLGERSYRVLTNNCEHLCEWCLNGASRSSQVERWLSGARRFACALLGTLGLVAGTPSFAGSASEHATRVEASTLACSTSTMRQARACRAVSCQIRDSRQRSSSRQLPLPRFTCLSSETRAISSLPGLTSPSTPRMTLRDVAEPLRRRVIRAASRPANFFAPRKTW